ncbi:MAG: dehydrogenase [Candidatus Taylorbacteria bacterium CG10_big_fil_rev_8_21_14_0_10_41_48]|uniref:Dehydrogenase n=1 Tax=Candidatus Taylorbacteria bacterium CG10_big_fil_rev_8_21_14_0_10_41_48 TaxID=1975024 RepID=A0A2M8LC61_9BACT|nr:MAG: dehydrogenase [Candidatus Taylorbacteria bacterium CG10_big_fil_rev_8_21_14_0_10_41_48]
MKKTLAIFSLLFVIPVFFVSAYTSPGKPLGRVSDFAGIFSPEQRSTLEIKVAEYTRPAGVEMAVVTVPSLGGDTVENFAVQLFAEWGIGQKLKDNGVLIIVAPTEREVRIEVGYGLEPYLTDAESSQIVRNVVLPIFKSGDYFGGIQAGINAIEVAVNDDPSVIEDTPSEALTMNRDLVQGLFFIGLILISIMARTKSWWLGGVVGALIGFFVFKSIFALIGLSIVGLGIDYLLSKNAGKGGGRGPGAWPFFISGGFGGGRGGGFGGFGGGMSGGGGASGRW